MSGLRFGMDVYHQQHQKLILAPRMIQSMEILQLPIADVEHVDVHRARRAA